ncbi:MAG: Fe-S cluster assembly protein IscX, partial [Gammaproteobacteria bacterium]
MGLKWTDSLDIAIELDENYPDVDPRQVRFTELRE